jgi:hypothetical protein
MELHFCWHTWLNITEGHGVIHGHSACHPVAYNFPHLAVRQYSFHSVPGFYSDLSFLDGNKDENALVFAFVADSQRVIKIIDISLRVVLPDCWHGSHDNCGSRLPQYFPNSNFHLIFCFLRNDPCEVADQSLTCWKFVFVKQRNSQDKRYDDLQCQNDAFRITQILAAIPEVIFLVRVERDDYTSIIIEIGDRFIGHVVEFPFLFLYYCQRRELGFDQFLPVLPVQQ